MTALSFVRCVSAHLTNHSKKKTLGERKVMFMQTKTSTIRARVKVAFAVSVQVNVTPSRNVKDAVPHSTPVSVMGHENPKVKDFPLRWATGPSRCLVISIMHCSLANRLKHCSRKTKMHCLFTKTTKRINSASNCNG